MADDPTVMTALLPLLVRNLGDAPLVVKVAGQPDQPSSRERKSRRTERSRAMAESAPQTKYAGSKKKPGRKKGK